MNVDLFFGMFPQEAAYESYNIQNILFNDREDMSLFLSSRGNANKGNKLEEAEGKGQRKTEEQDLGKEDETQTENIWHRVRAG